MVLLVCVCVMLHVYKLVQHIAHYELVEQDHAQDGCKHNESCEHLERRRLQIVWILFLHAQRFEEQFCLCQHDKIKDDRDHCQKQERKQVTSNDQELSVMVRFVNVLPDDLVGLGGFFHDDFCRFGSGDFVAEMVDVKKVLAEVFSLFDGLLEGVKD